ncbi:GFA family protein [Novosphingobium mangrovi (ex Hu et al. 2023)]|uniref:GFA family protein n=1 Tax=Novosphingobium mangrovi (ex Hu et al. 2023) TaxID=2930094 RepID=A0ABT0ADW3_9SPHN|nr:GFA family protein [Novosphingobium mangrovi (ex Hu et al. 2023)]MCJ1961390.1 GFA family protein [Novosphingobium mangrovi (ex Hu et al. 2023)]
MCQAVRYELEGEPEWVWQCYCRDCQLATGTGHTTIAGFHKDRVTVSGPIANYTTTGDTGGRVSRHFCPTCASRLFTTGDLPGPLTIFQSGTLDDPNSVTPTAAIYVKDKLAWDYIDPALPQFPGMEDRY